MLKKTIRFKQHLIMQNEKLNILVCGLLSSGSSALVDLLREYDNINVIPNEFDDFRAPGLVADQLDSTYGNLSFNNIRKLTKMKSKLHLLYNILPILNFDISAIKNIGTRYKNAIIRIKQLKLLEKLNQKFESEPPNTSKFDLANQWIKAIGDIAGPKKQFIVFNQPLHSVIKTDVWKNVFKPFKLICVYRDPLDQMAENIRKGFLQATFGSPFITLPSITLETIYGRSRKSAMQLQINALKKRYEWIEMLLRDMGKDEFLLIDFEGLVNDYPNYKTIIEKFTGNIQKHHNNPKRYFNPDTTRKSIGIYESYLSESEIEKMHELENWYLKIVNANQTIRTFI